MKKLEKFGIPNPIETKESLELFRASLGFDFIFTRNAEGKLKCYCIEINGHDSGASGVQDIPYAQIDKAHKIVAGIRSTDHPEMNRKRSIAKKIHDDMRSDLFTPSSEGREKILAYMKNSLSAKPFFKHAHHNLDFIEEIERDKRLQEKYIPEDHRPRTWHEGEDPLSSTGAWIVKHYESRGGRAVHFVKNDEFTKIIASDLKDKMKYFVVQECLVSEGAEMMPESVGRRAASMRFLMDFHYLKNGDIVPDFITAYQRVSPFEWNQTRNKNGEEVTSDNVFVVNRDKGAQSIAASPQEIKLAREVAEKIIQNIANVYQEKMRSDAAMTSLHSNS